MPSCQTSFEAGEQSRIVPSSEVDFVKEKGKVYIVKKKGSSPEENVFRKLRGIASVKMSTEEIMRLTRRNCSSWSATLTSGTERAK